jgi:BirA family transcriptional regulator, biotin operon repressor / biotin---[acetyl-CoA-carboxylase] ligase
LKFVAYGGFALYRLAGAAQDKAFRLVHHDQLASTNDEGLTRAKEGDPGQLWLVADIQTEGRGRNGRVWLSPRGNLHASLLLIDPAPPHRAAELGFVAGVAAVHALREILCGDRRISIKWPNDVLHDGTKVCGILLESANLPDGRFACVIGVGVNCQLHPANTPYITTNLSAIAGRQVAPARVFARLSATMTNWLDVWAAGAGFESIRAEWLSLAAGLGGWIGVARLSQTIEGTFQTIDSTGRLILEQPSGQVAIEAGDVFFSPRTALPPPGDRNGAFRPRGAT